MSQNNNQRVRTRFNTRAATRLLSVDAACDDTIRIQLESNINAARAIAVETVPVPVNSRSPVRSLSVDAINEEPIRIQLESNAINHSCV